MIAWCHVFWMFVNCVHVNWDEFNEYNPRCILHMQVRPQSPREGQKEKSSWLIWLIWLNYFTYIHLFAFKMKAEKPKKKPIFFKNLFLSPISLLCIGFIVHFYVISSQWLTMFSIEIIFGFFILLLVFKLTKRSSLPPGPWKLPFIGNMATPVMEFQVWEYKIWNIFA